MTENPAAGWYNNPDGKRQWWDGAAWGPLAETTGPPAGPSPKAPAPNGCGIGCLAVIAIAAIIGIASWAASNNPEAAAEKRREVGAQIAQSACEDAVKDKLKSPATADFSAQQSTGTRSPYRVSGAVDSQNGFGATIRSTFSCLVDVSDDDTTVSNVLVR